MSTDGTIALALGEDSTFILGTTYIRVSDTIGRFDIRRYRRPTEPTRSPMPIGNAVVIDTALEGEAVALLYTGRRTMLALWTDGRDGGSVVYAAPVELPACP